MPSIARVMVTLAVIAGLQLAPQAAPADCTGECCGDCNGDQKVKVDELTTMASIGLGSLPVAACSRGDANDDGKIDIYEILNAVNNAVHGCVANLAGVWAWDEGNIDITQIGSNISGYVLFVGSSCCVIVDNPKCYFTGTVSRNSFKVTGPNGTFTATGTVTGDHMSGAYTTSSSFCDGAQHGSFSAGHQ